MGFSEEIQRLTSSLETAPAPATAGSLLRNDLHWARTRAYLQPGLSYKADTWNASLDLPVSYYDFQASDDALAAGQRLRVQVAEPRLSARRDLGALWYASGGASLRNGFGDISQLNYAYLLRDYRTLQRNDAPLPRSIGQSSNFSLNLSASLSQQPQVLNGTLAQTTGRSGTATFKTSVSAFEWGSLDYSATFTALRCQVEGAPTQPLALLQDHHASVRRVSSGPPSPHGRRLLRQPGAQRAGAGRVCRPHLPLHAAHGPQNRPGSALEQYFRHPAVSVQLRQSVYARAEHLPIAAGAGAGVGAALTVRLRELYSPRS